MNNVHMITIHRIKAYTRFEYERQIGIGLRYNLNLILANDLAYRYRTIITLTDQIRNLK